jgi:hypothetical protein
MCHKQYHSHHGQLNHVLVHSITMLPPVVDVCAGNSASETVITPEGEEVR